MSTYSASSRIIQLIYFSLSPVNFITCPSPMVIQNGCWVWEIILC